MSSKIVLCDIEGTTTSIAFVKDNLFPYAAKNVESFLDSHWDEDEIKEAVKMLRDQSEADKKEEMDGCVAIVAESEEKAKQIESIVANVKWQMEHDRKAGPLKNLQGIMWVDAYKAGAFKGQVYEDVAPAFEAWTKAGRKIYIYSSGSVAIQKVHFEHSDAGDLAKYLSGYYDTKVGAKQEKSSYETIFKEISKDDASLNSADVLFLTDVPAEAKAAKEAGMVAILLKRPGNAELTEEDSKAYKVVESFADISFDKVTSGDAEEPQKRKIEADVQEPSPPAKVAKIDTEAVPTPPSPANEDETVKKTEEEVKDVPMAEPEKVESSGEAKKTEEKPAEVSEKAETMEVDSTTTTEQEKTAPISDDEVAKVDAMKDEQKTPCDDVEMKGTASEADTKTVTDNESPKDVEEKKANDVELAEEAKEKSDEVKSTEPVEVASTDKPVEETVKENGSSTAEPAKETSTTDKVPDQNGDVDSNGTEAKPQNGTKEAANGHDDSDKENDKSMEAQPDEVSTTSGPATETDAVADVVAAKKCVIDPQAPADQATPVPAEVEAES